MKVFQNNLWGLSKGLWVCLGLCLGLTLSLHLSLGQAPSHLSLGLSVLILSSSVIFLVPSRLLSWHVPCPLSVSVSFSISLALSLQTLVLSDCLSVSVLVLLSPPDLVITQVTHRSQLQASCHHVPLHTGCSPPFSLPRLAPGFLRGHCPSRPHAAAAGRAGGQLT